MNNIERIADELDICVKNIDVETIEGEITSIKSSNNNQYINIKNNNNTIQAIYWDNNASLKVGNNVKIWGSVKIFKKNLGIYFNVKKIELIKDEDIELIKINNLRKQLIEKGMINNIKKTIIKYPHNIGLITSLNGAVIEDIKRVFNNNNFVGELMTYDALMQGENCVMSVCDGIEYFENIEKIDIIFIARGGGESHHINVFSEEQLLEKIHKCKKITLTAIGHEIDNPLCNDVADYSAGTPSIGAQMIIKHQQHYMLKYKTMLEKIKVITTNYEKAKQKYYNIDLKEKIKELKNRELIKKINDYKMRINKILFEYEKKKNKLNDILMELTPILSKNNKKIISINEMYEYPKKVQIQFIDGNMTIYYKIV